MKKFLAISVILIMSVSIFAQNVELSNKLINQYKAGQLKASQKSADIHDYLWLTPILTEAVVNWDDLTEEAQNVFKVIPLSDNAFKVKTGFFKNIAQRFKRFF